MAYILFMVLPIATYETRDLAEYLGGSKVFIPSGQLIFRVMAPHAEDCNRCKVYRLD